MLEHFEISELLNETEALLSWGAGKVHYLPKQIKLFTDGAMYSQNMVLRDGYLDGHQGVWLMEAQVFDEVFKLYAAQKIGNGTKLVFLQHGHQGHHELCGTYYEKRLCDNYLSWGNKTNDKKTT